MKFNTFLTTYILFLFMIFASLSVVSIYMTNSQFKMLKQKSVSEYQMISASLTKDIAVLSGRSSHFETELDALVSRYSDYYKANNISIDLNDQLSQTQLSSLMGNMQVSVNAREDQHTVTVLGILTGPYQLYLLEYRYDITSSIKQMGQVQMVLLCICILFSIITFFALYIILSSIFKPLSIVASASSKIASGHYSERISIKGKHELYEMAGYFNQMAGEIERQMQCLLEEAAAKQQFVDNFAHEIRTPLTSIYGYAQYMQNAVLNGEEIAESSQYIIDEANHIKKIAGSLLELATLRGYRPVKTSIPIARLFEDTAQTMQKDLQQRNVGLSYHTDVTHLCAQEDLMKSLLLNLCTNALKHCAPNTGHIDLNATQFEDKIILTIRDNGNGIPPDSVEKVMQPFYRVDKARSRAYGGAGLGLPICAQIAKAHNADMTIASSLGVGTTIKVVFTSS